MKLFKYSRSSRLPNIALLLGALVVILSCGIGYVSFVSSKKIILKNVFDSNLQLARMLSANLDFSGNTSDQKQLLEDLQRTWENHQKSHKNSYLCVIENNGKLLLNTLYPRTAGNYVGDVSILPKSSGEPNSIQELIQVKEDWVGEIIDHSGRRQLVAYAYNNKLDALITVHVISDILKAEIIEAVLPWSVGLGLISVVLLPLSLGLIYGSFKTSEAKYQDLYENAPDMFISVDVATRQILECNHTLTKAIGFGKKELIGKNIFDIYDPGCFDKVKLAFKSLVETGEVKNAELQLRKKGGGKIDVSVNISAVSNSKGEVIYSRAILRDIGKRKRAEEIIRRHAEIVENIQTGLMVYKLENPDDDGSLRLTSINPMAAKLLSANPKDWVGRTMEENFPNARKKGSLRLLAEVGRSGISQEVEDFEYGDDKLVERVWRFKAFPLHEDSVGVAFEDVTERIVAATRVRENEEKYRTLTESALDGLIFYDLDLQRATSANKKLLEMFQVTREEFLKSPHKRFLPEYQSDGRKSLDAVKLYTKRALDGERVQFEWENKKGDGSIFNTEITLFPFFSQNRHYLIVLVKDISIRKKSELALKESEARYRMLVESLTAMIHITNEHGKILYINPAVKSLTGYTQEDFQKADYGNVHEKDRARVKNFIADFINSEKKYSGKIENRFIHKKGELRWHTTTISKIQYQGESVMQFVIHDITEIKKNEEAVRKLNSELEQRVIERTRQLQKLNDELIVINHRLAETQDIAKLGSWEIEVKTKKITWSDQSFKIVGLDPEQGAPPFEEYMKLVHPEDVKELLEKIEKAINNGKSYSAEFRHVWPDGTVKYVYGKGQPIYEDGEVVKLLGTVLDITEAKHAEKELTSKTKTLESYSANLNQLHRINTANYQSIQVLFEDYLKAGCDLFDLDTGIISKIDGDSYKIQALRTDIDSLEQGMVFPLKDTYCRAVIKNKKTISYHEVGSEKSMRGHPAYENLKLESYLGTHIVVNNQTYGTLNFSSKNKKTEAFEDYKIEILELMAQSLASFLSAHEADSVKEEAQRALQESERRFRKLTEIAPVGIYLTDAPGENCEYVNRRWQEITGSSAEEALNGDWINSVHPDDWNPLFAEWERSLQENTPFHLEYRFKMPGGKINWVTGTSIPIRDASGKITQHLGTITDITERKLAEEKISTLNQELKQQVAELKITKKELESFTYSVSHDLRAPLRAIAGYSKMLQEDFEDLISEEAHENFEAVISNTVRMGKLIDDLLSYSRLGDKKLKFTKIDIKKLSSEIFKELSQFEPDRKLKIKIGKLPPAIADSTLIRQVVSNLLANAIKFTSTRKEAVIEVGCEKIDGVNTYFIKDNGVGFNMKYADKLFGVFQRLHSMEEFEGTGVGLAIVQNIVQRHGGKIWAHSIVNAGTTFYFTILTEQFTAYEPQTN